MRLHARVLARNITPPARCASKRGAASACPCARASASLRRVAAPRCSSSNPLEHTAPTGGHARRLLGRRDGGRKLLALDAPSRGGPIHKTVSVASPAFPLGQENPSQPRSRGPATLPGCAREHPGAERCRAATPGRGRAQRLASLASRPRRSPGAGNLTRGPVSQPPGARSKHRAACARPRNSVPLTREGRGQAAPGARVQLRARASPRSASLCAQLDCAAIDPDLAERVHYGDTHQQAPTLRGVDALRPAWRPPAGSADQTLRAAPTKRCSAS